MKAIIPLIALPLLLASCAAPPKPAPVRPPPVVAQPRPVPNPAPILPPPADWRDAPQTPGNWSWSMAGGRSTATYGQPGTSFLVSLTCDKTLRRVLLARSGTAAAAVPLAVATTSLRRPLLSDPALGGANWLVVSLPAGDPLLDAIAFSRGRFALETAGLATLYLPAWPEISRVVEDCR